MRGAAVSRVLASKSANAKAGDLVLAYTGWQEYAVLPDGAFEPPLQLPANARPTDLLGVFGSTGLTAYFGLTRIGDVKAGDTVVVSGAAGATGSVVGQLAKIKGAGRVIGIAGSDEKCRWLTEELGFDVALNYKASDFREKFKEATPKFIDVYWDNGMLFFLDARVACHVLTTSRVVGGEILDMALARANKFARFVMCGGISQYNAKEVVGPKVRRAGGGQCLLSL
jgi:NADPH-dependent curcumin reductase CurA